MNFEASLGECAIFKSHNQEILFFKKIFFYEGVYYSFCKI